MALFERNDIAVDLGTVNTIVRNNTDDVLFCEATCIALENKYGNTRTLAIGNNAKKMLGRTPQEISVINPILNGAISDFETTKIFMQALIEKGKTGSFAPKVGISIPQNLTQVERHSLHEATMLAGAKEVLLIEDPFSASAGVGLDISTSRAKMIIDAGGGLVEASIISLGGLVTSAYTKEAGDFIDYAIMEFCRHNKNIGISKDVANTIKHSINIFSDNQSINVGAKNLVNGMPIAYELQLNDFKNLLLNSMERIKRTILEAIHEAPPQIAPDLIEDGATLTGGLALMQGLKEFLEEELKIAIHLSPNPLLDISKGVCLIMQNYADYEQGL
ncbi:rod shape-determining protein [Helicobacter sp. MIT 11-5569]|uniref:rod shape-determining protein n=1 Tax=Helicobacter sp. MIT 11-5569 TaxID=1548151 RepID=UPI00051FD3C7|nr:rod shape-determining protein [Helicobacter sp. MIT 11-5569]TLD84019.1 rod shape-determining protein [Helicobacter sp. MIT 11-5569]